MAGTESKKVLFSNLYKTGRSTEYSERSGTNASLEFAVVTIL
jgi:hypothetical protein